MVLRIDFEADFMAYVQSKLKCMGVESSGDDLTKSALLLFKLQRKCPSPFPRKVRFSTSFEVLPELKEGLELLRSAIVKGNSLIPFLSKSALSPSHGDELLDDWGITHFHLGEKIEKNGLISRTGPVAFGLVRDECVYFIQILSHGTGHSDVWVREELIWIIENNWPDLLPFNYSEMTSDNISREDRKKFRKARVNVTVAKTTGEVLFPPGGGLLADGTAIADHRKLQQIYADIKFWQSLCTAHESEIYDALRPRDDKVWIRMDFTGGQVRIYDSSSFKQIVLL